jgi:hypothetical protein
MFIEEITAYLADQAGGSWTVGDNVGADEMPDDPVEIVALFESGGEPANLIADIYTPHLRLLSRAKDTATARTNWQTAFDILNLHTGLILTNYEVAFIESIDSAPRPIERQQQHVILESWFRIRYKHIE